MKKMNFSLFGAFAIALAVMFTGCSDPCKDVTCVNGECVEGDCVCDAGYEGVDCGTALNAKFSGAYTINETCNPSGQASYAVTVAPMTGSQDHATFTGLWEEPQLQAEAHIEGNGTDFEIHLAAFGSWWISGSGSANADGSTINITYTIWDDAAGTQQLDQCSGTLTL